jgi:uracil-DNA glycosylase
MELNFLSGSWKSIAPQWQDFLKRSSQHELGAIDCELTELAQKHVIYPPAIETLRALFNPPSAIKVVILGQDPYHGDGEANGLAFAVNPGIKIPPSLRNIFKELVNEYNPPLFVPAARLLNSWEHQGVLLLNASLSVIKDQANSLAKIGWHTITDRIIQHISDNNEHCVFLLWGNFARGKKELIDTNKHLVLEAAHPSPLSASRGFFGCNHFKLANQYLTCHQIKEINWLE